MRVLRKVTLPKLKEMKMKDRLNEEAMIDKIRVGGRGGEGG